TLGPAPADGEDDRGERDMDPDARALWDATLAAPGGPLAGMRLIAARAEPGRIAYRVQAADDELISLPHARIARSLGIRDRELVVCQHDGLADGMVSVYEEHPLLTVREATVADLTMDDQGRIALGVQHDGRPARIHLYKPALGATTDLFVGAPGAGKSVALNTLLIAERISGVVSLVADAQDGMSLPECDGRVAHFGKGIAATGATLAAAYAVAKYRQQVSSANGWGSFALNSPWPLVNLTLDELNLILSAEAEVSKDFKQWVIALIAAFQSTGRKMGVGIRFAAQSIHLADLGDKAKLRANAKTGSVWMGRTTSSTTQGMATDGVLPPHVELVPIPERFGGGTDVDAAYAGCEEAQGPTTAGMANLIQGGTVARMRVWRAEKIDRTYPHLIALYESAPMPLLTAEEQSVFDDAYARALARAEQLLAADDGSGDDGFGEEIGDGLDHLLASRPAAPAGPAPVADRILAVLAEHGPLPLREIRRHLPDLAAGTVNNAAGELAGTGALVRRGRGVYALPDHP
ncbi:hypothetical protein, partial [Streptomyces calidiresistens]|uniref:hypothetical protein n=1 Tax=Streptomyces calidiresistens TaxID=1485586 RepID=UPI0015FE592B